MLKQAIVGLSRTDDRLTRAPPVSRPSPRTETVPPTPTLEESVMKRLSFFRLTRVLPASIALSGIAALVGCISPTTNYYGAGTPGGQRGGLLTDSGGSGVMVAGGPGAASGGVVPAGGFVDGAGNSGQRGGLLSSGGGWNVAQADGGTYVDGSGGAGQRGGLLSGSNWNGTTVDGGCASGNCASGAGRGGIFDHSPGMGLSCDRCAQIAPGSLPAQLGASVRAYHKVQKENADLDKYVVYLHEWYQNGTELGPFGRNHLVLIARRLPEVKINVIVQASPDAQLNETRRRRIVDLLSRMNVPGDMDARVDVGFPEAVDLDGNLAPIIYYQSLIPGQYQNNGYGGFGGGGFGGFGGGGFGGFGGGGFGGGGGLGGGFGGGFGGRPFGF
jgi:hypothetical protein